MFGQALDGEGGMGISEAGKEHSFTCILVVPGDHSMTHHSLPHWIGLDPIAPSDSTNSHDRTPHAWPGSHGTMDCGFCSKGYWGPPHTTEAGSSTNKTSAKHP